MEKDTFTHSIEFPGVSEAAEILPAIIIMVKVYNRGRTIVFHCCTPSLIKACIGDTCSYLHIGYLNVRD